MRKRKGGKSGPVPEMPHGVADVAENLRFLNYTKRYEKMHLRANNTRKYLFDSIEITINVWFL